jgi:hypothetical protein
VFLGRIEEEASFNDGGFAMWRILEAWIRKTSARKELVIYFNGCRKRAGE